MINTLAISLKIGASVSGALSGIHTLKKHIGILNNESLRTRDKLKTFGKDFTLGVGGFSMALSSSRDLLLGITSEAVKFETAMADVKKVVQFDTPEQFKAMGDDILKMTRSIPMAKEELAAIFAAGGRSGIAREKLQGFAEDAAVMGVAFDMTAEQAGTAMATLQNVLKRPIDTMNELSDAMNWLAANANSSGRDIVNVMTRAGSEMKMLGLADNQAAALSSTMLSMGKAPELAAQAIKGISSAFLQMKAGAFSDELAEIGLSTKMLRANMEVDMQATILDFIDRIKGLDSNQQYAFAANIFGKQYADEIMLMAQNTEEYRRQLQLLEETDANGKLKYQGSMRAEFDTLKATTEKQMQLLKNGVEEVWVQIGSVALPILNDIVGGLQSVTGYFADWAANNQGLLKGILATGSALAGVVLAFNAVRASAGFIFSIVAIGQKLNAMFSIGVRLVGLFASSIGYLVGTGLRLLDWAITLGKLLGGALLQAVTLAGKAIMFLGRALLTNPIGLIITAIAVGAYLIWDNWATLQPFFADLWANVTAYFNTAWEWIKSAWSGVSEWVSNAWGGVKEYFSTLWTNITDFFSSGIGNISAQILNWSPLGLFYQVFASVLNWFGFELPSSFTEFGANIIQGLIGGITSMWESLKETVSSMASSVKSWFTGLLGIHSPSVVFEGYGTNIGEGLAIGINNATGLAVNAAVQMANAVAAAMPNVATSSTVGVMNFATDLAKQAIKPLIKPKKTALPYAMGSSVYEPDEAASGKKSGKKGKKSGGSASSTKKAKGTKSTGSGKPKSSRSRNSPSNNYQPLRSQTTQSEQPAMPKSITVNFNPTINLGGANGAETAGLREQVQQVMQESAWEFEKLMYRILDQRSRRAY